MTLMKKEKTRILIDILMYLDSSSFILNMYFIEF